jgi:hypothetical protein
MAPPRDYLARRAYRRGAEATMRYLCLAYQEGGSWDARGEEELAVREEMQAIGHGVAVGTLCPERSATIRARNGELSIAAGPATLTTECLRAFYLIDAFDLNGAIRVAARLPAARSGQIEIWPIDEWDSSRLPQRGSTL